MLLLGNDLRAGLAVSGTVHLVWLSLPQIRRRECQGAASEGGTGFFFVPPSSPDQGKLHKVKPLHGDKSLVNNAGAGAILDLSEVTAEQIQKMFAVNVVGPSLLAKAALSLLRESKGSIINISSTYGHKAAAGLSHYAASKAALEHLTRCWALELAPDGIRVNAIAAGPTESGALTGMMGLSSEKAEAIKAYERELVPLKRRGVPSDVAQWVLKFAELEASWTTGQVISVDGGLSVA